MVDQVHVVELTDWQVTEGEVEHRTYEWDQIFSRALFVSVELFDLEVVDSVVDNLEVVQIIIVEDIVVEEKKVIVGPSRVLEL